MFTIKLWKVVFPLSYPSSYQSDGWGTVGRSITVVAEDEEEARVIAHSLLVKEKFAARDEYRHQMDSLAVSPEYCSAISDSQLRKLAQAIRDLDKADRKEPAEIEDKEIYSREA